MPQPKITGNIIAERLKQARLGQSLTQQDLADAVKKKYKIDFSRTTISEIEIGSRTVRDKEILMFSEILQIDPAWLLLGHKYLKANYKNTPGK